MELSKEDLQRAQRHVGIAMGACLAMWYLPFVSGATCSAGEFLLVGNILKLSGCHSKKAEGAIYWYFRKRLMLLWGGTYIPVGGVPLQLFETYAIGQFALHCASSPSQVGAEWWMAKNWQSIEDKIFSGEKAIAFYEEFTGKPFPQHARTDFVRTVEAVSKIYRKAANLPGMISAQALAGEALHMTVTGFEKLTDRGFEFIKSKFSR